MSDNGTRRRLHEAAEELARCEVVIGERLAAMGEAREGYPPSPRYDGDIGSTVTSVTFCEVHGKERCECGRGTPFPRISDRTGELALRPDRAASDRAAVDETVKSIGRQVERLARLLERYGSRPATEAERRQTLADNERTESCASCARSQVQRGVQRWEPAATRLVLEDGKPPTSLCQWCYRWVRSEGSLPPVSAVDAHHRGLRVRKPA